MRDLNDLIDSTSEWKLIEAGAVNNVGQIVGYGKNPSGKEHAFLLNPLPSGWGKVIETTPPRPTYGEPPRKEDGKDSLIVVTHGWNPDIRWVEEMTNAITMYLVANGLKNWQVHAHKWVEKAQTSPLLSFVGAEIVLRRGRAEGSNLGNYIVVKGWSSVHLISHSAGAALIQSASEAIKNKWPNTVVHTTFLDAFVGLTYGGREKYGKGVNRSDSYFSKDAKTFDILTALTGGHLDYAYNVDITWLDPNKKSLGVFRSSWDGNVEQCYRTVTSHEWPHEFYLGTINGSLPKAETKGFGFPLSEEGGGWDFVKSQYKTGNNPPLPLGTPDPSCIPDITIPPPDIGPFLEFFRLPLMKSQTGTKEVSGTGLTLTSGSPSWLAAVVPITNLVNFVSLETKFLSVGAEGLLTIYWETNVIGSIDERAVVPGVRQYMFPLSAAATNGTHLLGFRLDAFSDVASSVLVTNVSLGFLGIKEPFSLAVTETQTNGLPVLKLTGPADHNYVVEASTNLIDWTTIAILVNTNGSVHFIDPQSTKSTARFYRAVGL